MAQSLKDLLPRYARDKKIDKTLVATKVLSSWSEVLQQVSPNISAEDCRAVAYRSRTLIVEVNGSSLANELRFKEDAFLMALNNFFDKPIVDRLHWRIR